MAIGCSGSSIAFTNQTTGASSYLWNFGDNNTSNSSAPNHTYSNVGTYTVSLIAISPAGCSDTLSDTILIVDPPVPNFTASPDSGCAPLDVYFTNNSTGTNVSYFWDFGNGDTTSIASPDTITFQQGMNDTTYIVTLSATNLCGITT